MDGRKHGRVHVPTEPVANEYGSHRIHAPGEQSRSRAVGAEVTLDVAAILAAAGPRS